MEVFMGIWEKVVRIYHDFIETMPIDNIVDKTREILKGPYRKIAIGGFLIISTLLCSLCGVIKSNRNQTIKPTLSITEIAAQIYQEVSLQTQVAATVYKEIDLKTQIAATVYAQVAQEALIGVTGAQATESPYQYLKDLYPCLPENSEFVRADVVGIVDGDTINVMLNGQTYSVRYIGIDCPEMAGTSIGIVTISNQAAQLNRDLLEGQEIILAKDTSEMDEYGRLLRYVFIDNVFVNYKIIEEGMAYAVNYAPDTACSSYFASAQSQAKTASIGVWQPTATVPSMAIADSITSEKENCDSSYPTVCIPPYPPDLDCGDISYRRFQVLEPDPHGFDGDNDGVGCES